ncbi:MAG: hypothetical protein IKQ91_05430 [Oscillospiraceae bacterium]|nr:hypothetical protein [Oscillospiraceae bacterium]
MKPKFILLTGAAAVLACLACGCESDEPESQAELYTETTSTENTTAPVTTTECTTADPRSYMERHADLLTESAPPAITERREGVTYPQFEKYYYYSSTAERQTGVNVLLPAGYTADREYPVLYILHGSGDNEDWIASDAMMVNVMLTNLCADGLAKEMIVVSPYIYCSKDMPFCTGLDEQNFRNFDNFRIDLMTDLKPFIEENFSVAKDREHTAITGFSLGGREALNVGFHHPDAFGFLGSICPASGVVEGTGLPFVFTNEEFRFAEGQQPELFLLSAAEQDAAVGVIPYDYHRILTENGTDHIWHVMTDSGHEMRSVISHLYSFMQMIFLDE